MENLRNEYQIGQFFWNTKNNKKNFKLQPKPAFELLYDFKCAK